ncbi:MAG: NAD(+) diphosphatase [Acidimicrobiia bacterium]|nr:NAD(+) diphosphatase [Acidimicrobiia bacterium]
MANTLRPAIRRLETREDAPSLWFAFHRNRLLLHRDGQELCVPGHEQWQALGLEYSATHYLGVMGAAHCYAVPLADEPVDCDGVVLQDLRSVLLTMDSSITGVAGLAFQIVHWDRTHQFCGQCGQPMEAMLEERARQCTRCDLMFFPRLCPVIIVRVCRGEELLLARSPHTPPGMYSVLAGFVEPGETLEEAVAREVMEEAGISIGNVRYFGSQPWPFPHSLMIGFTAEHEAGEIRIDGKEIENANWYSVESLPKLPPPISIGRRLIDDFVRHIKDREPSRLG